MGFLQDHRVPLITKNAEFDQVGAGKTSTARLPVGTTFLDLNLQCTVGGAAATRAQLESDIAAVRLTVDGKEKMNLTGTQLVALVEFYEAGAIGDTGQVWIPFERPWMQEIANQVAPAYGMLGKDSFQIEIDLAGGAVIDAMVLRRRTHPIAETLGDHVQLRRFTPTFAATGDQIVDTYPKISTENLFAVHFFAPIAISHLTRLQLRADDATIIDTTPADYALYLRTQTAKRTLQTAKNVFTFDFCSRGLNADALPLTMNSLQWILTWDSAPGSVVWVSEVATNDDRKGTAVR